MRLRIKVLGIVLLSLFSTVSYCQTASAIFQSDNKTFQVTINHIIQHNDYNTNIRVNKLFGDRPYNIKINFENDTAFVQTNIYLIDDGLTHIYQVSKDAIQLKKVVPTASYTKTENQLIVSYTSNNQLPIETAIKDTTIKDTAYLVPFASYYKLEDYGGKIGCPFPIKDIEQAELRGIILAENLEESKLEKAKIAIQDMDSACVLITQTKELIVLFEFEETRLDFAKFITAYTFDIDNYEKLYSVFNYENSKDELKQLFKKNTN